MNLDDIARVIELQKLGKTLRYIGREFGVCHVTVLHLLNKHKIQPNPRALPRKISTEQVALAYLGGMSSSEISKKYGVDRTLIFARLKEANITPIRKLPKTWIALAKELYIAGFVGSEISKLLGLSKSVVLVTLKQHGLILRTTATRGPRYNKKYPKIFNKSLKLRIRTRDGFVCKSCGMTELENKEKLKNQGSGMPLSIHHIDYDKRNCQESNLITLCLWCNSAANKDKANFKEKYSGMIAELIKTEGGV